MTILPILAAAAVVQANTATTMALTASMAARRSYSGNSQRDDRLNRVLAEDRKEETDMMAEDTIAKRKYTFAEIDQMRNGIHYLHTAGGGSYYSAEMDARVERELRTYMMSGTDPEDIKAKVAERSESMRKMWEQERKWDEAIREDQKKAREAAKAAPSQAASQSWTGNGEEQQDVAAGRTVSAVGVFVALALVAVIAYFVITGAPS